MVSIILVKAKENKWFLVSIVYHNWIPSNKMAPGYFHPERIIESFVLKYSCPPLDQIVTFISLWESTIYFSYLFLNSEEHIQPLLSVGLKALDSSDKWVFRNWLKTYFALKGQYCIKNVSFSLCLFAPYSYWGGWGERQVT